MQVQVSTVQIRLAKLPASASRNRGASNGEVCEANDLVCHSASDLHLSDRALHRATLLLKVDPLNHRWRFDELQAERALAWSAFELLGGKFALLYGIALMVQKVLQK